MEVTSTHGLLLRGRAGDAEALSLLFERYRGRLAVLIHYRLGQELRQVMEVDDVIQEVLLRACRDMDQFSYQSPGSFFRWLASITDHVITDLSRHEHREKRRAVEMVRFRSESNPRGPEPVDTETPSRVLAHKESVEGLIAQLDALPEAYRRVIVLTKIEGLSTVEVGERMGRSRESVALLLHRAIKRFRSLAQR